MTIYFEKYLKYKKKYITLKKNILNGGMYSDDEESVEDSNPTEELEINNTSIISFYFNNFNMILDLDIPDETDISELENTLHISVISGKFNITKILPLLKAKKNLTKLIAELIEKESGLIELISKNILISNQSQGQDISNYMEYLRKNDMRLYQRILKLLESSDECCVCMDNKADTIFQCGHSICRSCSNRLNICPICRKNIVSKKSKEELLIEKKEMEENDTTKPSKESLEEETNKKLTLNLISLDELIESRLENISRITNRLNDISKKEMEILAKYNPLLLLEKLYDSKSEEVITYGMAILFKIAEKSEVKNILGKEYPFDLLINPNRLISFLKYLENDKVIKLNFKKAYQRDISKQIELMLSANKIIRYLPMILSNKKLFKLLFRNINISKLASKNEILKLVVDSVRDNTLSEEQLLLAKKLNLPIKDGKLRIVSLETQLQELMAKLGEKGIFEKIIKIFNFNPGLFIRNIINFLSKINEKELPQVENLITHTFNRITLQQLADILHEFEKQNSLSNILKGPTSSVYFTSKGTIFNKDEIPKFLNKDVLSKVKDLINRILLQRTSKIEDIDTVIINPNSKLQLVNKGDFSKAPSWAPGLLSRGDRVELTDDNIITYIFWQNGKNRVDLDIGMYGLNEKFVPNSNWIINYATYGFNNTIKFSGDITNAPPPGVAEHFTFSINELLQRNQNLRYLVVTSLSYNNISYDDMGHALVGVGINNGKGTGPLNSETIGVANLRGNSTLNTSMVIDLIGKEVMFMNLNTKGGSEFNNIQNNQRKLTLQMDHFMTWLQYYKQQTHYELATKLTKYKDVIIHNGNDYILISRGRESDLDFQKRIEKNEGSIIDIQKYLADNSKKVLSVGKVDFELPKGSVIVDKFKQDVTKYDWTDNMYSILAANTKRNMEYDELMVRLGGEGIIEVDGQIFRIESIEGSGDCLFDSIISQIDERMTIKTSRELVAEGLRKFDRNRLQEYLETDWLPEFERFLSSDTKSNINSIINFYISIMESGPENDSKVSSTNQDLPTSAYWGGYLELIILSNRLRVNINVIQGNNITYSTGEQHPRTIFIYYTGSHYNIARNIN
mgnify:CR=1 FL=1